MTLGVFLLILDIPKSDRKWIFNLEFWISGPNFYSKQFLIESLDTETFIGYAKFLAPAQV